MRSYSSVLSHILGSHPEICGHSELHCQTLTRRGFRNAERILAQRQDYAKAKFLYDKLLHNGPLEAELIESRQVIPLVCVRQPEQTQKSIINMGQLYCQDVIRKRKLTDFGQVTEYYVGRVAWLERFVTRYRDSCFVFRSEQLLSDKQSLLDRIQAFLGLNRELHLTYQVFENTGLPGHGDPSPKIRLGTLDEHESEYDEIQIPTQLQRVARQAYDAWSNSLSIA